MDTTVRAAIADLRGQLAEANYDGEHTDRFYAYMLKTTASVFIRRETNLRRLQGSQNIYQPIPCLEMEEVALSECCSYRSDCTVARSVHKLPKLGENNYGHLVQGVWGMDFESYIFADPNRYANMLKLGLKKVPDCYWFFDEHLYVSNPDAALVKISAYFEEDIPASLLVCGDEGEKCPDNPLDLPFRCPGYLVGPTIDKVKQDLLNFPRGVADKGDLDKN